MRTHLDVYTWTVVGLAAANLWFAGAAAAQEGGSVEDCRQQLDACVQAAQIPADIDVCSEQEARCIAGEMQVPVPESVPLDRLILCTATAAECALAAPSADSLNSCTWNLSICLDDAIADGLSCLDRWSLCVATDPLLLPICSLELLGCTD